MSRSGLALASAIVLARCLGGLESTESSKKGTTDASVSDTQQNDVAAATCEKNGGRCVDPAPSGWTGPFAIYDGLPANAPTCAAPVLAAEADLIVPAANACTCSCKTPTGLGCGAVPVTFFAMSSPGACGGCSGQVDAPNGACVSASVCGTTLGSMIPNPAATTGGSCESIQSHPDNPDLSWGRSAVGCSVTPLADTNCWQEAKCLPKPGAPYESALCVFKAGDVACPGTPYSEKRVFYASAEDTRGCAPCTCGAAQGGSCTGSIAIYDDSSCASPVVTYNVPQECIWKSSYPYVKVNVSPSGGSCAPGGGEPTGTVTPKDPITVCCEKA